MNGLVNPSNPTKNIGSSLSLFNSTGTLAHWHTGTPAHRHTGTPAKSIGISKPCFLLSL